MTTTSRSSRSKSDQHLSSKIESLLDGFRRLSRAATLKELAHQFVGIIRNNTASSKVDIFYRTHRTAAWQRVVDSGERSGEELLKLPRSKTCWSRAFENTKQFALVQQLGDKSYFGMVLGRGKSGDGYSSGDAISARLFGNLFETAYQELLSLRHEKELVFSLNHRVLQLTSLIDTGIEISKNEEDALLHHLALERAASLTNASKGVVRVMEGEKLVEEHYFPDRILLGGKPRKGQVIRAHFNFAGKSYRFELHEKESRSGVQPFEETDQLLLDALSRQVHASFENRFLHQQALEKERIERDIAVAAAIQKRILPTSLPIVKGYDIAGVNIPSKWVGGDYYDCRPLPDGRFALIIADVAGKGVQAALLVSSLHAYLSAYLESQIQLDELAQRLNKVIFHASPDDKFITAFIAILAPESGQIEFVNAGHNPAYILRANNEVQELPAKGLPLGMLDMDLPCEMETITIGAGERLLLYTDGITEAADTHDVFYDTHSPLIGFVGRHRPDSATQFVSDLIRDIKQFTGSAPQNDDITALYVHRIS
jgi:serine phosphatase RsbU (regulator of sigma subunit)